jgi:hypothetical protein
MSNNLYNAAAWIKGKVFKVQVKDYICIDKMSITAVVPSIQNIVVPNAAAATIDYPADYPLIKYNLFNHTHCPLNVGVFTDSACTVPHVPGAGNLDV